MARRESAHPPAPEAVPIAEDQTGLTRNRGATTPALQTVIAEFQALPGPPPARTQAAGPVLLQLFPIEPIWQELRIMAPNEPGTNSAGLPIAIAETGGTPPQAPTADIPAHTPTFMVPHQVVDPLTLAPNTDAIGVPNFGVEQRHPPAVPAFVSYRLPNRRRKHQQPRRALFDGSGPSESVGESPGPAAPRALPMYRPPMDLPHQAAPHAVGARRRLHDQEVDSPPPGPLRHRVPLKFPTPHSEIEYSDDEAGPSGAN